MKPDGFDGATNFEFGVGARYYFHKTWFGRVGLGGQKLQDVDMAAALDFSIGYDWFLSEKVYFEPSVYYNLGLGDAGEGVFGLRLGLGVKF